MVPYSECKTCIATSWCKIYSKEVVPTDGVEWCKARYRLDTARELSVIPKRYHKATVDTYIVDDFNKDNWEKLLPIIDDIVNQVELGVNFFLYGTVPGTGKTYTASCLLNEYIKKTCLTSKFDFETPLAMFVTYADLMNELRYRRGEEYSTLDEFEVIKQVPLLLLDDIGSGTTSPFTIEQTYLLLNHRINNGLSTIITSNLTPTQLAEPNVIGGRSVSRILSDCTGFTFKGEDRRRRRGGSQ